MSAQIAKRMNFVFILDTVYAVRRSQNGALLNVALEVPLFLSDNGHS